MINDLQLCCDERTLATNQRKHSTMKHAAVKE